MRALDRRRPRRVSARSSIVRRCETESPASETGIQIVLVACKSERRRGESLRLVLNYALKIENYELDKVNGDKKHLIS